MAQTLTLAAGKPTAALVTAVNYLKAVGAAAVTVRTGTATALTVGGTTYTQPAAIVAALSSGTKGALPSASDAFAAAQATQWLQFAFSDAAAAPTAVADVDQQLASASFLAGQALSVADVTTYVALHAAFSKAAPAQQAAKPHLQRWCAQVQAQLAAVGVALPEPAITAPHRGFKYTVSAAAAAPAAAAAATGAGAAAAPAPATGAGAAATAAAPEPKAAAAPAAGATGGDAPHAGKGKEKGKKGKKEKKAKKGGGGGGGGAAAEEVALIAKCEFKVGTITKAWEHPEADKLYCEEIDCGEDAPRQIASGLREYMPLEALQGARVLVFANLKPRPFKGFASHGMVLCASAPGKSAVEFVVPPEGVPNGEVVTFEGHPGAPDAPNRMAKKKVAEKVLPDLALVEGVATWKGVPFMTSAGPVKAATMLEGTVG